MMKFFGYVCGFFFVVFIAIVIIASVTRIDASVPSPQLEAQVWVDVPDASIGDVAVARYSPVLEIKALELGDIAVQHGVSANTVSWKHYEILKNTINLHGDIRLWDGISQQHLVGLGEIL